MPEMTSTFARNIRRVAVAAYLLIALVALAMATQVHTYGDATTQNSGWTIGNIGGYETHGTVGFFTCDGQC